jgi:hypothetical protein
VAYRLLDDEPASALRDAAAEWQVRPARRWCRTRSAEDLNSAASIDETLKRGVDTVGRQVGLTARAVAKNVTGIPSMVGDALGLKTQARWTGSLTWRDSRSLKTP